MTTVTPSTSSVSTHRVSAPRDSFWTRIATELADAIARGVYVPNERLPSEHTLAELYGVNRHTIRRALASLCSRGLLRATQGSGTYVEEFAVDVALARRVRHQQSMASLGLRGALHVIDARNVRATAAQARTLRVPTRSTLLCLHVLGDAEQQPMQFSERYFPLPRFAGLDRVVRETGSITAGFAACGVADYTRLENRITAQMPERDVAAHLKQSVNRPVLLVESVNVDPKGEPIEFSRAWFAGDRVTLTVAHEV